nr:adenylate/guanylate cyclase domain-containing protein [Actinomycetes bacterium]
MASGTSIRHRMTRMLGRITGQGRRPPETPEFGSRLLGSAVEGQRRLQILAGFFLFVVLVDLIGIAVVWLIVAVAVPEPDIYTEAPAWLTFGVAPAYPAVALIIGSIWGRRQLVGALGWSIVRRPPTRADQRNTLRAPWHLARIHLLLWGIGAVLLSTLYGFADPHFIPKFLFGIGFIGVVAATNCYLVSEFALRPAAAQAIAAGHSPGWLAAGVKGRIMTVWILGSGIPVLGIVFFGILSLRSHVETHHQFVVGQLILSTVVLVIGFTLMWIVTSLTATPVRVVRTALHRVEEGDLDTDLVVFDGTEIGELQHGFNSMVEGLRERERVRDLFGRHVGQQVAADAEQQRIELGGAERHVAVLFVDVEGSTGLTATHPPMELVDLLNRFFAVIVDEVYRQNGSVNKFVGDAILAVFGAPTPLKHCENNALAAARAISHRLREEVPEFTAGVGVTAGTAVAGNIGAH